MKRPLMIDPARTAMLFVDLQEEHRRDQRYLVHDFDVVLANAQELQETARQNHITLVHCAYIVDTTEGQLRPFHPMTADGSSAFSDKGSQWTAICKEVKPAAGEVSLIKSDASCFSDGRLEPFLRSNAIEWLFISGVWTEACVDATVKDAVKLGFRVVLVKDACGSGTPAMHETAILNLANRLYGGAVLDTQGACAALNGTAVDAWMVEGAVPLRYGHDTASTFYRNL